jgi:two-component system phosphate regulon sensor histidine kinase PhoR
MAIGDSQRDDVAIERRRTALMALVAMSIVLGVLALGGVLVWEAAVVSDAALMALIVLYLAAAGQADAPRKAAAASKGEPVARFSMDESARAVLDALPDPVVVVRAGGRVETVNAAARRELRAYSADSTIASLVREPRLLDAVEAALAGGDATEVEYKDAAPRERYFRALIAPFRPGDGAAPHVVVVVRDETAIKRSEAARADFLANASHELRTPLSSLTGFIETLSGHARNDEEARDRFLRIMSEQADRMRRLINDLLSLSRLEQSEHVAPRGSVDLAKVAGEVLDAMAPVARERGVALRLRAEDGVSRIAGDRDEILQVVQNLLENAVKYSAPGGEVMVEVGIAQGASAAAHAPALLAPQAARLTLTNAGDAPDAPQAWLRISDRGRGIERRHLPRLAERFFRCDPEEAAAIAGTGLGLAIVCQIMTRHRGGVAVESARGAGSRFTIYARLLDAAQGRTQALASQASGARAESPAA